MQADLIELAKVVSLGLTAIYRLLHPNCNGRLHICSVMSWDLLIPRQNMIVCKLLLEIYYSRC
jgi:hypothetical protein